MISEYAKKISSDARKLGIKEGDVLLVHSSLKSLGDRNITPKDVIDGLRNCLGESGTLVFPTLSYMYCGPDNRTFDYRNTPSNVGAIPEYFRTNVEGAVRSLCPTHSCAAVGANADYITKDHYKDTTPCGKNSPFRRVMELGGKILFLGCGNNCNTSMHAIEELVEPDYLYGDSYEYDLIDKDGTVLKMNCRSHGFEGVEQCYYRAVPLLDENEYRCGNILAAECHLLDAKALWAKAEKKYREDNHYFIDIL